MHKFTVTRNGNYCRFHDGRYASRQFFIIYIRDARLMYLYKTCKINMPDLRNASVVMFDTTGTTYVSCQVPIRLSYQTIRDKIHHVYNLILISFSLFLSITTLLSFFIIFQCYHNRHFISKKLYASSLLYIFYTSFYNINDLYNFMCDISSI